jgi:KUP system potassium uptake protein
LKTPETVEYLFYACTPESLRPLLVILATAATVVASQAVITGAFSLTSQAIQMGFLPRMRILHTSSAHRGQIYIGGANRFLWFGAIFLVWGFEGSGNLAEAYGLAVSGSMWITSVLFISSNGVVKMGLVVAGLFAASVVSLK